MVARLTSCCFLLHRCEQRKAGGASPSSLQCPGGRQCHYHLHLPFLLLLQAIAQGRSPVPYGGFGFLKWVWKRRKSTHCPTEYERQISLSEHHSSSSWTLSHVLLCCKCTLLHGHLQSVLKPAMGPGASSTSCVTGLPRKHLPVVSFRCQLIQTLKIQNKNVNVKSLKTIQDNFLHFKNLF